MARNHRYGGSLRSKSPSLSPDRPRKDDLEAQKSAVGPPNTQGSMQKGASDMSTRSSTSKTSNNVPPETSFDGASSPESQLPDDPKSQLRIRPEYIQNEGATLQATVISAVIPLPVPFESSLQGSRDDGEPASRSSALLTTGEPSGAAPFSRHPSNRSLTIHENRGAAHRGEAAVLSMRSRSPGAPNTAEKIDEKSEPTGDTSSTRNKRAEVVWKREKNRLNNMKESIKHLLIFSGILSGILTAFIVPLSGMLQTSRPGASAQALVVISSQLEAISGQLNTFASGVAHLNVTQPIILSTANISATPPTPHTTISTCILWSMALICSLGATMIGIVVSRWLQHHDPMNSASRQSIRIWYFADGGFTEWRVQNIIDGIPLLLQFSVALFLVGITQLLFTMNVILAGIVTALVAALLTFSAGTTLIATFALHFPSKLPQARYVAVKRRDRQRLGRHSRQGGWRFFATSDDHAA